MNSKTTQTTATLDISMANQVDLDTEQVNSLHRKDNPKRKYLKWLFDALIIVPAIIASSVLWYFVHSNLQDIQARHFASDLQMFTLILGNKRNHLHHSLTRIAGDNFIQTKVDLDNLPQLRQYLRDQSHISHLDNLYLLDNTGQLLVSADPNKLDALHTICPAVKGEMGQLLTQFMEGIYILHTHKIFNQGKQIGSICGGIRLNANDFKISLRKTLAVIPVMWIKGQTGLIPGTRRIEIPDVAHGTMFEVVDQGAEHKSIFSLTHSHHSHTYIGMITQKQFGSQELMVGVFLPNSKSNIGLNFAIMALVIVPFLIAIIALVIWHYYSFRKRAQDELHIEKENALATLSSIGDCVITVDLGGRITYMNPAAERLTRKSSIDVAGLSWDQVLKTREDNNYPDVVTKIGSGPAGLNTMVPRSNSMLIHADGQETAVQCSATPIHRLDHSIDGLVMVLRDVNQEYALQRRLAWHATRDELTGLINRSEFRARLRAALQEPLVEDNTHAVLYLDLDQFKIVNDACGHHAGDELLKQLTAKMRAELRTSDTLARIGGDEFAILLYNCPHDRALLIANKIREKLHEHRFSYKDKVFQVGVSIGLLPINDKIEDVDALLSSVDAACYAAKEQGRNRVHVYEGVDGKANRRLVEVQWVPRIRQALREDRFELFFQSIAPVNRSSNNLGHIEILIRMLDDVEGRILPGEFLPIAEQYGLISEIDRWVINTLVTRYSQLYHNNGLIRSRIGMITVNLSGLSISDGEFLRFVKSKLQEEQIPPGSFAFEITESTAITHLDEAIQFINELKSQGCQFLLDDFGIGMSSFGHLKYLPVDYLKIDGMFVRDIVHDPIDRAMVNAINEIGHIMGLKTIAEYVENKQILEELNNIGVDFAQGYHIAKPKPLDDLLNEVLLQQVDQRAS